MTEDNPTSDGELLKEFTATGSETAFGEIVRRHGPMVRSVCQRVLTDYHEAEDAAQAVFLTLAQKAGGLRSDPSIGGWLHRVAWCVAMDTRKARERRQRHEGAAMRETGNDDTSAVDQVVFRAEVDTAIAGLPDRYRRPVVLFHLEDRSGEETARILGLSSDALRTRLVRAREMLRRKLVRRGVAVGSVGALTTLLSAEAGAAVLPATFVSATAKAAGLAAAGQLAAGVGVGVISHHVAALTKGAVNMLFWSSVKTAAVVTAASVFVAGTGMVVAQKVADKASDVANTVTSPPVEAVTTNNGIVITTMVPKTIWMDKEPLKFTVHLQNVTEAPIYFGKTLHSSVVLTHTALRCSYSPHRNGTDLAGDLPSTVLNPKETMDVSVDLSQQTGFRLTGSINTNLFDITTRSGSEPRDGKLHSVPRFLPAGHYDLRVVFDGPDHNRTDNKPGTWMPAWTHSPEGTPNVTPLRIQIKESGKAGN